MKILRAFNYREVNAANDLFVKLEVQYLNSLEEDALKWRLTLIVCYSVKSVNKVMIRGRNDSAPIFWTPLSHQGLISSHGSLVGVRPWLLITSKDNEFHLQICSIYAAIVRR